MKSTLNAIEMTLPEGIQPIAMAGSGFLRAFVWKSEDRCQFSICRENPDTGDIETSFGPGDVEHLARLMAVVANVFSLTLHDELGNDLGCLAHCLANSLGFDINDFGMTKRTTKMQ
jgi:hypothetical protein